MLRWAWADPRKTKIAIDTAEILFAIKKIKSVLVVAPLSIVNTWDEQLTIHSSRSSWVSLVGSKQQRLDALDKMQFIRDDQLKIAIINYDGLPTIKDELFKCQFDLVILDESVMIKNRTTVRAKIITELFSNVKYKVIVSGNPIPKSPVEIFSQYRFLESGIFGSSFYGFQDKYFDTDYFNSVVGFKNEAVQKEFTDKMHSITFRKTKMECLSLPPKIYEKIYIDMSPEQTKVYKQMLEEALATYEDKTCVAPVVITKFLRLSQIAGGFFPTIGDNKNGKAEVKPILPNAKMEALMDVIEDISEKEQIVVWARFIAEIQAIKARLDKEGITCAIFYGDTTLKEREQVGEDFKNKKIRVFIGNQQTGGMGINFLVGSSNVIYYSNDYSANNRAQSEDRTHRSGSTGDKVLYIDLLMKDTIDVQILQVLKNNQDFSDAILSRKLVF